MSGETTSKSGKTWIYVVGFLALVPLLYLLSVGPGFVLMARGLIPEAAFETAYLPLGLFVEATGTGGSIEGYLRMWTRLTGTPL